MPTFRNTLIFVGSDGGGWSEVYYEDASDISTTGFSNSTISARLSLLHSRNKLRANRIVQADAPRVSRQVLYNLSGNSGAGGSTSGPLPNADAIVLSLASQAGGSRKLWLRGAPQAFQVKDPNTGDDAPPATLLTLLGSFFRALAADGFGIRKLTPQTPGPTSNLKILSVDGSRKDGTSDVTLIQAPGYPFPSRVVIGGASKKNTPYLNGQWALLKAPAGAVVTIPYQTAEGAVITGGNAHMRQALYLSTHVFTPGLCGFDHYGSHDTRSVNFRSRGARRVGRLRTAL